MNFRNTQYLLAILNKIRDEHNPTYFQSYIIQNIFNNFDSIILQEQYEPDIILKHIKNIDNDSITIYKMARSGIVSIVIYKDERVEFLKNNICLAFYNTQLEDNLFNISKLFLLSL